MNQYLMQIIETNPNMPIVFDYDGVLFESRWYEKRINMPNETNERLLAAMQRGENLQTQPIPFMIEWVKTLNNPLFVLSHMHNDIEYRFKVQQIRRFYPRIEEQHVWMATSINNKIDYLQRVKDEYGTFIYIDDNHPVLMRFENIFDSQCKFFHVSSLYV